MDSKFFERRVIFREHAFQSPAQRQHRDRQQSSHHTAPDGLGDSCKHEEQLPGHDAVRLSLAIEFLFGL